MKYLLLTLILVSTAATGCVRRARAQAVPRWVDIDCEDGPNLEMVALPGGVRCYHIVNSLEAPLACVRVSP